MKFDPIKLYKAIISISPDAQYSCDGDCYEGLTWYNNEYKPTEEEIVQKIAELEYQEEVNEYQRQRAAEYPPYADQFDEIFHKGIDAWKASIQKTKDKYPKIEIDVDLLKEKQDKAIFELQTEKYVAAVKRLESKVIVASDEVPETIQTSAINPDTAEVVNEAITNPAIVKDEQERSIAQAVIDATPQEVIDSLS